MCMICEGKGFILKNLKFLGELVIRRCDSCDLFQSDNEAVERAYGMAEAMWNFNQVLHNIL